MKLRLKNTIKLILILSCISLYQPLTVHAATTTSLAPSSGTHSSDFTINLNVETTDPVSGGIDVNINYSGPIDYVSASEIGDDCFSFSANEVDSSTVRIICMSSELTGNTDIASITFRPTGEGTATISVEHNSGSGGYGTGTGGGTYTITSESSSTPSSNNTNDTNTTNTTSNSSLPQAALQKHKSIIIGISFIIVAIFISTIYFIKRIKKKKNPEKYKTLDQLRS